MYSFLHKHTYTLMPFPSLFIFHSCHHLHFLYNCFCFCLYFCPHCALTQIPTASQTHSPIHSLQKQTNSCVNAHKRTCQAVLLHTPPTRFLPRATSMKLEIPCCPAASAQTNRQTGAQLANELTNKQ